MKHIDGIAQELFDKIHSRFGNTSIRDEKGEPTGDPEQARFFNFNYSDNTGKNFGVVTISIIDGENLKFTYGKNISKGMNSKQKKNWSKFMENLRLFAMKSMLKWEPSDISRQGLTPKDIRQSSQVDSPIKVKDINLEESLQLGNRRFSYQNFGPIKLIVRHQTPIDIENPVNRSHNIKDIFFQNNQGEKFKCPHNNLTIARALANHLAQNGRVNDSGYTNILQMVEGLKKLSGFIRRSQYENYSDPEIVELVKEAKSEYSNGRSILKRLSKTRHYESALNEVQSMFKDQEIKEEDVQHIREKLTKHVLDKKIESALPDISALFHKKKRREKTLIDNNKWLLNKHLINSIAENISMYQSSIKYSTMDSMVEHVLENLEQYLEEQNLLEYKTQCQGWKTNYAQLESLVEKQLVSKFVLEVLKQAKHMPKKPQQTTNVKRVDIIDQIVKEAFDEDENDIDMDELQDIFDSPLEFGADGDNAVSTITDVLGDLPDSDKLMDMIYRESQDDPDQDARPLIKYFLLDRHPEIHDRLNFEKVDDTATKQEVDTAAATPPPPPPTPPEPTGPAVAPTMAAPAPDLNQPLDLSQELPQQPLPQAQPQLEEFVDLKRLAGIK